MRAGAAEYSAREIADESSRGGNCIFPRARVVSFFTLAIAISTTAAQTPGVTDKITAF
jgi:hypothetical protein